MTLYRIESLDGSRHFDVHARTAIEAVKLARYANFNGDVYVVANPTLWKAPKLA
jgi:hypothetical protein